MDADSGVEPDIALAEVMSLFSVPWLVPAIKFLSIQDHRPMVRNITYMRCIAQWRSYWRNGGGRGIRTHTDSRSKRD
jgi:hypothetical protein